MAVKDIELNVGVKFDEAEFIDAYQSALSKTSAATQQAVDDGISKLKGSAAPNWNTLPYVTMHDASSGQRTAAKAFLASLAHDLNAAGITSKSKGFSAAMTNAAYIGAIPDTTERFRRLRAEGLYDEAALTAPGSALSSAIESDYALMQQGWSRNFIKSRKNKAGVKEAYIDFKGMREYAVNEGFGRWIDETMPRTADNFELINDELEKIEDKSDKTKKLFTGWNDDLKSVLGTLTAIGGLAVGGVIKIAANAEKGTLEAGGSLSKQRAFINMSALDELRTKVASKSVGLSEDAIRDEIYSMSGNIEQYKLTGQGDALPSALLGIFNNLIKADDPYDVYLKSADQIYKELKGMDKDQRRQWRMLMIKAGLGSMSDLVGQFISNPEYAQKYGTPSALFNLESNPYYGVYGTAETMLPDIAKLKASLQASYNTLYTTWEETFGIKFTTWWDDVMKERVVPWFQKILGYLSNEEQGGFKDDVSDTAFQGQVKLLKTQIEVANAAYNLDNANAWTNSAAQILENVGINKVTLPAGLKPDTWGFQFSDVVHNSMNSSDPKNFWAAVKRASIAKGEWGSPYETYGDDEKDFRIRASRAKKWAEDQGYAADFERWGELNPEQQQKLYAARAVMQAYMATGNYDETLSKFGAYSFAESEGFKILAEFIKQNKDIIRNDPEKTREIKIRLLDPYGRDMPIEVLEGIVGDGFKFTAGDRQ